MMGRGPPMASTKSPATLNAFALAFVTFALSARAEPRAGEQTPQDRCASTFRFRLKDARQAIEAHLKFREAGKRALAWWAEHCHALDDQEETKGAAAPAPFACDTQRGRPPGLTVAKIREYMSDRDIAFFQRRLKEDQQC